MSHKPQPENIQNTWCIIHHSWLSVSLFSRAHRATAYFCTVVLHSEFRLLRRTINWWLKERMVGNPTATSFPTFIWAEFSRPTHRDEIKSLQILLSRTLEEISPNLVQRLNLISVYEKEKLFLGFKISSPDNGAKQQNLRQLVSYLSTAPHSFCPRPFPLLLRGPGKNVAAEWRVIAAAKSFSLCKLKPARRIRCP